MIEYVLTVLFAVAAILGISELIHIFKMRLKKPCKKATTFSVMFLTVDCAEQQLLYAAEQQLWLGNSYADKIYAVTDCLEQEQIAECSELAKKNNIILCTKSEICRLLTM